MSQPSGSMHDAEKYDLMKKLVLAAPARLAFVHRQLARNAAIEVQGVVFEVEVMSRVAAFFASAHGAGSDPPHCLASRFLGKRVFVVGGLGRPADIAVAIGPCL